MIEVKLLDDGGYPSLCNVEFPIVVSVIPIPDEDIIEYGLNYDDAVIVDGRSLGVKGTKYMFTSDEYEVING